MPMVVRTRCRWRSLRAGTPSREFTGVVTGTHGRVFGQQVHVAIFPGAFYERGAEVAGDVAEHLGPVADVLTVRHAAPVVTIGCHRPGVVLGLVLVRYRYRLCPSAGQRQSLARVFGCARVVYNDCLRLCEESHAAGEQIGDTGVQRRVITLAKLTPEREWLAEVSSVALVQACNDAAAPTGTRSIRCSTTAGAAGSGIRCSAVSTAASRSALPATGSPSAGGGCMWRRWARSKKVRWSRPLPSPPSSVTVIREPDRPVLRLVRGGTRTRAVAPLREGGGC